MNRVASLNRGTDCVHLDTFLDRSTILNMMTQMLTFKLETFYDGDDDSVTPTGRFGQALVVLRK